jgi:hypothetical protein
VPDFLVRFLNQIYVIVEVKGWGAGQQNIIASAKQQTKYYKKLTGAAHAFLVIKDLKKSIVNGGIISAKDPLLVINDLAKTTQKKTKLSATLPSIYILYCWDTEDYSCDALQRGLR